MKIGITVPDDWRVENVRDVVALGDQAEQLGCDSIWTMDHRQRSGSGATAWTPRRTVTVWGFCHS
jgi:hypothetical protein